MCLFFGHLSPALCPLCWSPLPPLPCPALPCYSINLSIRPVDYIPDYRLRGSSLHLSSFSVSPGTPPLSVTLSLHNIYPPSSPTHRNSPVSHTFPSSLFPRVTWSHVPPLYTPHPPLISMDLFGTSSPVTAPSPLSLLTPPSHHTSPSLWHSISFNLLIFPAFPLLYLLLLWHSPSARFIRLSFNTIITGTMMLKQSHASPEW